MDESILYLNKCIHENQLEFTNNDFKKIAQKYIFYYPPNDKFEIQSNQQLYTNLKDSNYITINQYSNKNANFYFILSFQQSTIIANQSYLEFLKQFFLINSKAKICFLLDLKDKFNSIIPYEYQEIKLSNELKEEIRKFKNEIKIKLEMNNSTFQLWNHIFSCICCYLIQQAHFKTYQNRIENFNEKSNKSEFIKNNNKENYVELRNLSIGSSFRADLAYDIENERLVVIKEHYGNESEYKLVKREDNVYSNVDHPLFPKIYGKIEGTQNLVIEYIPGKELGEYNQIMPENTKINIIFELALSIEVLHQNRIIYRDLKPNNIMIDNNNIAVLIDFDRSIKEKDKYSSTVIYSEFQPPDDEYSIKFDVYSLGKVIEYIINEKEPNSSSFFNKYKDIMQIIKECLSNEIEKRPTIIELILVIYSNFYNELQNLSLEKFTGNNSISIINKFEINNNNYAENLKKIGNYYYSINDINKAIKYFTLSSDLGLSSSQYKLGRIYHKNNNLNESIKYFLKASRQDNIDSYFMLGFIYYNNLKNISIAIEYFKVAADKGHAQASSYLGSIYYVNNELKLAFYYISKAAEKKNKIALYNVGLIYYKGEIVPKNINKAIYYFTEASEQGHVEAMFYLGYIYEEEIGLSNGNIDKCLSYYIKASFNNCAKAQHNLGLLYYNGIYTSKDIHKSIFYFDKAAKQDYLESIFYLGYIYFKIIKNIEKATDYFEKASQKNHAYSKYYLGLIYYKGIDVKPDNQKAFDYFSQAAVLKVREAQYYLGIIYTNQQNYVLSKHYFKLSANQDYNKAQFVLGKMYLEGINGVEKDIKTALKYLELSSKNNNKKANFYLGCLYYTDINYKDIKKSISNFKEASTFNNFYAKNNLGVIYKNGFEDKIKSDLGKAIQYFNEAIQKNDDCYSKYNLARIYIFDDSCKNIDKSLDLLFNLIEKSNSYFFKLNDLLNVALIEKFGHNLNKIEKELKLRSNENMKLLYNNASNFINQIQSNQLDYQKICEDFKKDDYFCDLQIFG